MNIQTLRLDPRVRFDENTYSLSGTCDVCKTGRYICYIRRDIGACGEQYHICCNNPACTWTENTNASGRVLKPCNFTPQITKSLKPAAVDAILYVPILLAIFYIFWHYVIKAP